MIIDQLVLNNVEEIQTNNIGSLSFVGAVFVEERFNVTTETGNDIPTFRNTLREKAVNFFADFYASKGLGRSYFSENTEEGVETLPDGQIIKIERVNFVNPGEDNCETIVFQKVFFIPAVPPEERTPSKERTTSEDGTDIPDADRLKICNLRNFKSKVRFIQTFMKINFIPLQRPARNRIVRGINFKKFSITRKKLTSFLDQLDGILEGNKPSRNENIYIYFSQNYQTIARIEYENEFTREKREVFKQSEEEYRAKKYKAFNDQRANFYVNNYDSIYSRLFAETFNRNNKNFKLIVSSNLLAPGVTIETAECLSQSSGNLIENVAQNIADALAEEGLSEARNLLEDNPFKTAEDLVKESGFLSGNDLTEVMKAKLKKATTPEGNSIKREFQLFLKELNSLNPKKELKQFGSFINTIEWNQMLVIAVASIASRYGLDEVLDDEFAKKIIINRISKTFNDARTLRAILRRLNSSQLQKVAIFLSAISYVDGQPRTKAQAREERARRIQEDVQDLQEQIARIQENIDTAQQENRFLPPEERTNIGSLAQERDNLRDRLLNRENRLAELLSPDEAMDVFDRRIEELETRIQTVRGRLRDVRREDNSENVASIVTAIRREAELEEQLLELTEERAAAVRDQLAAGLEEIRAELEDRQRARNRLGNLEEDLSEDLGLGTRSSESPRLGDGVVEETVDTFTLENQKYPDNPEDLIRNTLELAGETSEGEEGSFPDISGALRSTSDQIIELIVNITDCDRSNNAIILKQLMEYIVLELGAPVLEYFDEWSQFINAWELNNLDFCNLPDINRPKFKLFPSDLDFPNYNIGDLFKFIFEAILAILFALLLRLLKLLVKLVLGLIPDFIFDFEPCDIANALRDVSSVIASQICSAANGNGTNLLQKLDLAACKVLKDGLNNRENNINLVNFFSASCDGLLPGKSLFDMLKGEISDDTLARYEAYTGSGSGEGSGEGTGNGEDTDSGLRTTQSSSTQNTDELRDILSEFGQAIGQIIGVDNLFDSIDDLETTFPIAGFNVSAFQKSIDLCDDPELEEQIANLCANDNPVLRQQLLEILERQQESDRQEAARLFGYLSDPNALTSEIQSQIPNLAHPSMIIPAILKGGGSRQDLPEVKNTAQFAVGRDQEELENVNRDVITNSLRIFSSCLGAYSTDLINGANTYSERKAQGLLGIVPNPLSFRPPETGSITIEIDDVTRQGIINSAFNNSLYITEKIPASVKSTIEEMGLLPGAPTETTYFEVGKEYYRQKVVNPMEIKLTEEPFSNIVNIENAGVAYSLESYETGLFLDSVLTSYVNTSQEVNFDSLASQFASLGRRISRESVSPTDNDENKNIRKLFPLNRNEEIFDNYLNGEFKQTKTYKRFIEGQQEYSDLLLSKTDAEVAVLEEFIKTIIVAVIVDQAHLLNISRPDDKKGQIYLENDLSTNTYNVSSLSQRVKEELNDRLATVFVEYQGVTIRGLNAISYYLYEIYKVKGALSSLRTALERNPLPSDILNIVIQDAIEVVNTVFLPFDLSGNGAKTSLILERADISGVIAPVRLPRILQGINFDLEGSRLLNDKANSVSENQTFFTSVSGFVVSLREDASIRDDRRDLFIELGSLPTGKSTLKVNILNDFLSGGDLFLDYDDVFSEEDGNFFKEIYNLLELTTDFQTFVFNNFNIEFKYKILASHRNNTFEFSVDLPPLPPEPVLIRDERDRGAPGVVEYDITFYETNFETLTNENKRRVREICESLDEDADIVLAEPDLYNALRLEWYARLSDLAIRANNPRARQILEAEGVGVGTGINRSRRQRRIVQNFRESIGSERFNEIFNDILNFNFFDRFLETRTRTIITNCGEIQIYDRLYGPGGVFERYYAARREWLELLAERERIIGATLSDTFVRQALTESENATRGLNGNQNISFVFNLVDPEEGNTGAGYSFVELASHTQPVSRIDFIDRNNLDNKTYRKNILRNYFTTNSNYTLSLSIRANPEINIVTSFILPVANIINEGTSYFVEAVNEVVVNDNPNDIRDLVFRDSDNQISVASLLARTFLDNER